MGTGCTDLLMTVVVQTASLGPRHYEGRGSNTGFVGRQVERALGPRDTW